VILPLEESLMAEEKRRAEIQSMRWAHQLGQQRNVRDVGAAGLVRSEADGAARLNEASLERWRAIVICVRRVAAAYNSGAKRDCLRVAEQSGHNAVTVTETGEGKPYLTAALEDTIICIRGRHRDGGSHATEVRLRPDRGDDATAAYVLQNWMQRL
jgi:hypothetical protein